MIGHDLTPMEAYGRRLFGIDAPEEEPERPRTATVLVHVDLTAFEQALRDVARAFADARRSYEQLRRRLRRHRTNVHETPERSRMHAAYRAKTRRRRR